MQRPVDGTQAASVNGIEGTLEDCLCVPLGAYLLALGMGILAFFAVVSAISLMLMAFPPLPLWVDPFFLILFAALYLVMAILFGFLWPTVGWKWGLWLSLPCLLSVTLIYFAGPPNETGLAVTIICGLLIVTFPACTCAFVGHRCAPSDTLSSAGREEFKETIPGEQAMTTQAFYVRDERINEIDKSEADGKRTRDFAYIPTPVELRELFQQFQP